MSGYWNAMVPEARPGSVLLLGVGGGTVAHLIRRKFGAVPTVGVDDSADILLAARRSFGLSAPEIELVQMDAFTFTTLSDRQFDFIAVDLYRGSQLARGVLALPFLRTLRARLTPVGHVAYNLFRDVYLDERVARLERVFDRTRIEEVAANAVFHGRPRRRQR